MSEAKDIEKVVEALKTVPEKKLRIIELANSIPIKDGNLDIDVLSKMAPEINLATQEAIAYGNATIRAIQALVGMTSKPATRRLRRLTDADIEVATQF
jgi:hypothetical protein